MDWIPESEMGNVYNAHYECLKNSGRIKDYSKVPITKFKDRFVKKMFSAKGNKFEHLWVKVEKIKDERTIIGILDNVPVYDCGIQEGDPVSVSKDEIELVYNDKTERFEAPEELMG